MTILLDLTEEQIGLIVTGLCHVSDCAMNNGADHTAEAADAAIVAVAEAGSMGTTIPVKEILDRAYSSILYNWDMENRRVQRLHSDGKPAPIAEKKEQELWRKQEELHEIICKMEEKENV